MPFAKAYIEGITQLQAQDIEFAKQLGYRIKLLASPKKPPKASSCGCTPAWCLKSP
jgi:homoserine dehydrogenase